MWKAYFTLGHEGYQHYMVNHDQNFKDHETNTHTNTVEGVWNLLKGKLFKYIQKYCSA